MYAEKIVIDYPEVDEDGLMLYSQQWNTHVAQLLAENSDIFELTADHWRILYSLREHYHTYKSPPAMSLLCRKQGIEANCVQRLFSTRLNAWRVAGLPNPGEEAKSYMSVS